MTIKTSDSISVAQRLKLYSRLKTIAAKYKLTPDEFLSDLETESMVAMRTRMYTVQLLPCVVEQKQLDIASAELQKTIKACNVDEAFKQFCQFFPFVITKDMVSMSWDW